MVITKTGGKRSSNISRDPLQVASEKIGVNYYTSFKVLPVEIFELICPLTYYFPMAEVYEKGRWRRLVVGGRPYLSESMARSVIEDAEMTQAVFLKTMEPLKTSVGGHLHDLSNPLDHWKYKLEL